MEQSCERGTRTLGAHVSRAHSTCRGAFLTEAYSAAELLAASRTLQQLISARDALGNPIEREVRQHAVEMLVARLETQDAGVVAWFAALEQHAFTEWEAVPQTPADYIRKALRIWEGTSGLTPFTLALQRATAQVFGLPFSHAGIDPAIIAESERCYGDSCVGMRQFVRAQYDTTQAFLAAHHMSDLPLYRGMWFDDGLVPAGLEPTGMPRTMQVMLRPLTSWSAQSYGAAEFATGAADSGFALKPNSVLLAARVPAVRVMSIFPTGLGYRDCYEVVLLGNQAPDSIQAIAWRNGDGNHRSIRQAERLLATAQRDG